MAKHSQRWGVVSAALMVGVFVAGMGTLGPAWAEQIASGLLRSNNYVHCSVVNLSSVEITVRVAILNGDDGSTCADNVQTIGLFEAGGVKCTTDEGAYCVVTGIFDKGKVRGVFSSRNAGDNPLAAIDLR